MAFQPPIGCTKWFHATKITDTTMRYIMSASIVDSTVSTPSSNETEKKFPMTTVCLCGVPLRMIVTDAEHITNCRSTWYCLKDLGDGIGSSNNRSLLELLNDKEKDSMILKNNEIGFDISEKSRSNETLQLRHDSGFSASDKVPSEFSSESINPFGQRFVSLRGALEIMCKTKIKHLLVESFQDEIYGNILPSLAMTGKAEISTDYQKKVAALTKEIEIKNGMLKNLMDKTTQLTHEKEQLEYENDQLGEKLNNSTKEKHRIQIVSLSRGRRSGAYKMHFQKARDRYRMAENDNKEKQSEIDKLKEQISDLLEDWKTARDFCFDAKLTCYDMPLKWKVSEDLRKVCDIFGLKFRRGEHSLQYCKKAFDLLMYHFKRDTSYLKEYRVGITASWLPKGVFEEEMIPDVLAGLV